MNHEIPLALAVIIVICLVCGSGLTLIGCIGLVRFTDFYDRLHMPTLGTSWGIGGILIASVIYSSFHVGRPVFHELLITFFLVTAAPVTLMMISRAAALRDNTNDWSQLSGGLLPEKQERNPEEAAGETPRKKHNR